ncbi:MAG: hypothetical protein ACYC3L_07520 [Gemmatimonadaceae bacterium]
MTAPSAPLRSLALAVHHGARAARAFTASEWGRFWTSSATGARGR